MTYNEFKEMVITDLGYEPQPHSFSEYGEGDYMYHTPTTNCSKHYGYCAKKRKPWIYAYGYAVGRGLTLAEAVHNSVHNPSTH